jgi:hypothetical protein
VEHLPFYDSIQGIGVSLVNFEFSPPYPFISALLYIKVAVLYHH